ncbi:MAG: trigger factor, partial [Planctomycetota bacterium]
MSTDTDSTEIEEAKPPLQLNVEVEKPHPCKREVVVTIGHADVVRYTEDQFKDLAPEAQIPGFRPGRAPRQLLEKQFKESVKERVKSALLMDALGQITDSEEFNAISEPDFDFESIEMPDKGDFKFQFSIEVRPEFDTPQWQGMELTCLEVDIDEDDVQLGVNRLMKRYATTETIDDGAEINDVLVADAIFRDESGNIVSELDEEKIALRQRLSFPDAVIEDFGDQLKGIKSGESKTVGFTIKNEEDDSTASYTGEFNIVEISRETTPEATDHLVMEMGGFENVDELKVFVKENLERQETFHQQGELRKQVVALLTQSADFDLPPDLVKKQTRRELQRSIMEMRRYGLEDDVISGMVNEMQRNSLSYTENSLREHFILEQIAEELEIDAEEEDYEDEIELIAQQQGSSKRSIRARLEKSGQMDALRNQIIERKVVEKIVANGDVTMNKPDKSDRESTAETTSSVAYRVVPMKEELPEAMYDN